MTVIVRPPEQPVYGRASVPAHERREPKFKEKTTTIRMGPDPLDAKSTMDWFQAQNAYPNLAEDEEIAANAAHYVRTQRTWMQQRNFEVREKWITLDYLLRGNSVSSLFPSSEIHVPELYKSVEALVPRIVGAILEYEPWFKVQGLDKEDKSRANKIEAWLQYQLTQDNFEDRIEEWARAMVVYQFCALKTQWHVETRKQVVREHTKTVGENGVTYTTKAEEKEVLVYEGLKATLVDPYAFICDTSRTDPQKMSFIGDSCRMLETEMQQYENMGHWVNLEQAFEQTPNQRDSVSAAYAQDMRSLDSSQSLMRTKRAKGEPREYNINEIWCKWQPKPDWPIEEYVLTVVEDGVAVRVQKNPYDDKHRPYCIARAAKEPYDFWNVGVLDHAVRIQNEMDDQENLAVLGHKLSICPITYAGNDWDGPSNIFDIMPGQVFATNSPPTWYKSPATIGEHLAMKENLRREIEETVGVPRIYEGNDRSNTATEIERKIQEGNRRTRRLILSFSDCLTQMLRQTWSNTRQYVTDKRAFRVLGAQAQALGVLEATLELEDLADPADIVIRGLRGQQSHGLRATQMATFVAQIGPLIPELTRTGDLSLPGLAHEMFEGTLGYRLDQKVLRIPQPLDTLMDPEGENIVLMQGTPLKTHEMDDHKKHIPSHEAAREFLDDNSAEAREARDALDEHIELHYRADELDAMKQRAIARSNPAFQPGEAAQQKQGGDSDGRNGRAADLMGDVPQGTPPGETPGPPRAAAVGAADRTQPIPQTENRR